MSLFDDIAVAANAAQLAVFGESVVFSPAGAVDGSDYTVTVVPSDPLDLERADARRYVQFWAPAAFFTGGTPKIGDCITYNGAIYIIDREPRRSIDGCLTITAGLDSVIPIAD